MGFITNLPNVQGKNGIYVVVDRLINYSHLFSISTTYSTMQVADLFFKENFRLCGLPKSIMSYRDNKFMRLFWK